MNAALRQIGILAAKDLRLEARNRQTLGLVVILGLLIIVVLGLGLDPRRLAAPGASGSGGGAAATATLWVAYLFSGVLCFEKTMAVERHDGALAALLMAPIDRGVIYAGKLISNLALMLAMAAVVTPAAIVLFGFDLSAGPGRFALIMALSMLGFAAIGTLFSAAVSSSRLAGGFLAMVIFPIALPLVIASTQLLVKVFGAPAGAASAGLDAGGLAVLVVFDVLYLTLSWIVFELLLEP